MLNLINKILFYVKVIFLLMAFVLTLYISFLKVDFNNQSILHVLPLFIPFLGLLILAVFGFFFNKGNDNIFYNLGCVLAFLAIIIISLRTLLDNNIINPIKDIGFDFFTMQETRIKVLLYLLLIGNIALFYQKKMNITKIHS